MIYFARLDSRAIKIGFTMNLDQRLIDLRSMYSSRIEIIGAIPGTRETEREIHRRFAHHRFGVSEQFRPGDDLMDFIGSRRVTSPDTIREQGRNPNAKRLYTFKLSDETIEGLEKIALHHGLMSDRSAAVGKPNSTAALGLIVANELGRIARKSGKSPLPH